MDNPFEHSETFKYPRHVFQASSQGPNGHHHSHSQGHLGHPLGDYSLMNTPLLHPQQSGMDALSRLASVSAHESHDDLCVDQCMGVGLYNGSQFFNHRGLPPGVPQGWAARSMSSRNDPGLLYNGSFDMDAYPGSYRGTLQPSHSDMAQHSWYNQQFRTDSHVPEDECQSMDDMSCCDSQCTMTGKCTNIACANKDDACTDQNCPSRPVAVPPEVASGAAALISITHAPGTIQHGYSLQSSGMDGFGFGMSHHPQQNTMGLPNLLPNAFGPTFGPIMNHVLVAHNDANSSDCTRPCPLDDPRNYGNGNCHLPVVYHNPALFNRLHSIAEEDVQMNQLFPECGAEINNSEAFLAHYNEQHRQAYKELLSSLQDSIQKPARLQHEPVRPSTETTASHSPGTPLDTSDSGGSANTPSPLTPLSHSIEMTDTKRERASPSLARSMSEESSESGTVETDADYEHKCLWRDNPNLDICGQIFPTSEELFIHAVNKHIKYAIKGDQGFGCGWQDCPRSAQGASGFPQRSKIERHMQTHIGHKPHVCSICSKGFSAKQALNQHMFIHTEEKPLECNICHKTFRYPSALTMHQRIHTGIKPLKCPVCGKMFSESSNLSKHKRTHEVRGRFSCSFAGCNRDFHRQDQLRRHMKTHQKEGDGKTVDAMMPSQLEAVF